MFLLGLPKIHIFHVCLVWPQVRWLLLLSSNCNIVRLWNILWWQQLFRKTGKYAYRFATPLRCFKVAALTTLQILGMSDCSICIILKKERKKKKKRKTQKKQQQRKRMKKETGRSKSRWGQRRRRRWWQWGSRWCKHLQFQRKTPWLKSVIHFAHGFKEEENSLPVLIEQILLELWNIKSYICTHYTSTFRRA